MDNLKPNFTDVNVLGEFGLIERLTSGLESKHASTVKGVGDDAAVLNFGDQHIVVSTDMLVEGIHFDLMYSPLKHLGYKAIIVNLSDIYAMNAEPKQVTVSVAFSSKYSVEAMEELYLGISVTGDLGAAYLGLQILEREKQLYMSNPGIKPDLEDQKYILERQLKPEARKDAFNFFARNNIVPTSMIDISDGLASDLMHICKSSDVGAYLEEGKIPIKQEAQLMAIKFQLDPVTTALNGGEDYELLFTIDEKDLERIRFMHDVCIIGEITEKKDGIKLHTTGGNIHPLKAQGWNHFDETDLSKEN